MSIGHYVYSHCTPDGVPFYVGKGTGPRSHALTVSRNKEHQAIVAKYGVGNIQVFVSPMMSEYAALQYEKWLILHLRTQGIALVNQTAGGQGSSGYRHTSESKQKLSAMHKGKKISTAHKKAISTAASSYSALPEVRAARVERMKELNQRWWADTDYRAKKTEEARIRQVHLNRSLPRINGKNTSPQRSG